MNEDLASLENLRDIALPPVVPWFPFAAGWWFVLACGVAGGVFLLYRVLRSRRRNAYRRAALEELHDATTVAEVAEVLKRTALAVFPRGEVASLAGGAWVSWLENTGGSQVPSPVRTALTTGVFDPRPDTNLADVVAFAARWIRLHRSSSGGD